MEEWIRHTLSSNQADYTVLIAIFLFGLFSIFTCACNFSIIAIVAGYSGSIGSTGKAKVIVLNSLLFFTGMIISMMVVGAIIGYASELISASLGKYWKIIAGLIVIFFGLFTLDLLSFKIPNISLNPTNHKSGIFSSVIFGLTIGGLTLASSSFCNPVFPIVLAVSFVKGSLIWGILLMFAYALGYCITITTIMIGIGLGFGKTSRTFTKLGIALKYTGGIIMIVVGFYLLITI
ncbi:MAG: hypothetical protein HOO91_11420 [Bacteroidales bacterium]|nr:hypothetical protein [Bacteroidales bacterium]